MVEIEENPSMIDHASMTDHAISSAVTDTASSNGSHIEPTISEAPAAVAEASPIQPSPNGAAPAKEHKSARRHTPAPGRSNFTIIDPKTKLGGGYSSAERAELEMLYGSALSTLKDGEIIKGKVVSISDGEITVDIGFKSEGVISKSEFSQTPDIKPGDEIEVFLESIEDKEGRLVLSRKRAEF